MSYKTLKTALYVILLGALLGVVPLSAAAQESQPAGSRPRMVTKATSVNTVPAGQEATITGTIIKAQGDLISVCDLKGAETVVVLSPSTKITTHRRGIFRGAEIMDKSAFLIGLRVETRGRGNDSGQLAAKWVKFHDSDFRSVQQLESRAYPIEVEQARQGDQLDETTIVAKTAKADAARAQSTADTAHAAAKDAMTEATLAHDTALSAHSKIAAIDDFEQTESLTVLFKAGSWKLSDEAKASLDAFAAKAATTKGFVVEISGFASSEGGLNFNHSLSAKRAEVVMDYLVGVGNVPVRRIIVPYSGGELNPVADNATREGREANRRTEVKMLVSKGLAAQEKVANK